MTLISILKAPNEHEKQNLMNSDVPIKWWLSTFLSKIAFNWEK